MDMERKRIPGIFCLAAGIILLLACLLGLLLSRVENEHAPLFLRSLREESAVFALLLSHLPETAGIGAVLTLTGLLCLTELPGDSEDMVEPPAEKPGNVFPEEGRRQEVFSPPTRPEFRMDFPEKRALESEKRNFGKP